jgi:hypothetical protein
MYRKHIDPLSSCEVCGADKRQPTMLLLSARARRLWHYLKVSDNIDVPDHLVKDDLVLKE